MYNKDATTLIQYAIGKTEKSFTIPDSVTSIGDCAFYYCSSLTSVTIPDSVTSIGNAAFERSGLTSVTIPDSVTSIGDFAFFDCISLISADANSADANIEYCSSLTSIKVDANNKYYSSIDGNLYNKDATTIIQYASGKTEKSFTIPDSVTSIGNSAFEWSGLTSITIPDSVTSIGDYAFYYCFGLTDVYYTGTETQWNNISDIPELSLSDIFFPNATIHFNSKAPEPATTTTAVLLPTTTTTTTTTTTIVAEKPATTTTEQPDTTSVTTTTTTDPVETKILGDPSGDGKIDSKDAVVVLQNYAKSIVGGSVEYNEYADVNKDGKVDSKDAVIILKYYAASIVGNAGNIEDYAK